jgi:hypothetical protein
MIKIRFFLIFIFISQTINSQNNEYISIDSLDIIYNKNYRLSTKLSPIEFTDIAHDFLELLEIQRKVYKSFNDRKISKKTKLVIDQLIPLQVKTYLDLMLFGTIKNNIDSIQLYKTKILPLSENLLAYLPTHIYTIICILRQLLIIKRLINIIKALMN